MCTLGSFFSSRPSELRHIFKSQDCYTIQHMFVLTRSVWRKIEKIQFSRVSNSKFVIFPQIFPRSCYRGIKYSPVATTGFLRFMPRSLCKYKGFRLFPCINYRGINYSPVVTTGDFCLQENATAQCTHCALVWTVGYGMLVKSYCLVKLVVFLLQ